MDPRATNRSYSFEEHDEVALSSSRRPDQYATYDAYRPTAPPVEHSLMSSSGHFPPYRDAREHQWSAEPADAYRYVDPSSASPTPVPPPHHSGLPLPTDSSESTERAPMPPAGARQDHRGYWSNGLGYSTSQRTAATATPGVDNMGESAAGGGIAGIAYGVASHDERDSGMEAIDEDRATPRPGVGASGHRESMYDPNPYMPPAPTGRGEAYHQSPYSSTVPLSAAAAPPPARSSIGLAGSSDPSLRSYPSQERYAGASASPYLDDRYSRYSSTWDPRVEPAALRDFNPNDIEDDGDDDGMGSRGSRRRSVLSFGRHSSHGILPGVNPAAAAGGAGVGVAARAAGGAAAAGGVKGAFARLFGRGNPGPGHVDRGGSAQYGPLVGPGGGGGGGGSGSGSDEKSEWLSRQNNGKRKMRWLIGAAVALILIGVIVGTVLGVVLSQRNKDSSSGSRRSSGKSSGVVDPDKQTAEVKALLDNPDLRRVFPGMDYTPPNGQYPECIENPPLQQEITMDVAVMAQLTKRIRLYGMDCNQTDMVLHAIDRLELADEVQVWMGVWLDANETTNARQLRLMYEHLDKHEPDRFAGVIVGNEVLFRKDMSATELGQTLTAVKRNFTSKQIDLPVATSDLGDGWTAQLATQVDIVMSNVHPFFSGTAANEAAGWTWDFWQDHDVRLTGSSSSSLSSSSDSERRHIISEVGWPSGGGAACGEDDCDGLVAGSVAGIDEMNTFMDNWVCQSMSNGTEYFW